MNFEFDNDDEKLESQLRQFRPLSPRALPGRLVPRHRRVVPMAMLGLAASILFAVIFFARQEGRKQVTHSSVANQISAEPVTLGKLRRMTDDPVQLDSQLDSLSHVLPDVRRTGGVLSKLALESR